MGDASPTPEGQLLDFAAARTLRRTTKVDGQLSGDKVRVESGRGTVYLRSEDDDGGTTVMLSPAAAFVTAQQLEQAALLAISSEQQMLDVARLTVNDDRVEGVIQRALRYRASRMGASTPPPTP